MRFRYRHRVVDPWPELWRVRTATRPGADRGPLGPVDAERIKHLIERARGPVLAAGPWIALAIALTYALYVNR